MLKLLRGCRRVLGRVRRFLTEAFVIEVSIGAESFLVQAPWWCYYADPFLLVRQGQAWIFFEEFEYLKGKGRIACRELLFDNPGVTTVLETEYHLSFPFLLEDGGQVWMIPESSVNRTIDLYRAANLPNRWAYQRTLLRDVEAVDSVLHKGRDRWWLFTFVAAEPGRQKHLEIYSSEELLRGDWVRHPIGKDRLYGNGRFDCGRNAGPLFWHEGRLIRPSQNNTDFYGQRLQYFEIVKLDTEDFEEIPYFAPDLPWESIHQVHLVGDIRVTDRRTRKHWRDFFTRPASRSVSSLTGQL